MWFWVIGGALVWLVTQRKGIAAVSASTATPRRPHVVSSANRPSTNLATRHATSITQGPASTVTHARVPLSALPDSGGLRAPSQPTIARLPPPPPVYAPPPPLATLPPPPPLYVPPPPLAPDPVVVPPGATPVYEPPAAGGRFV